MGEILDKEIGAETGINIAVVGGKLKLEVMYDGSGGDVSLALMLEPDYFLDKLAEAIPGDWDKALIEIVKGAIKVM